MREQWEENWKDYYKILQVDPSAEPEVIDGAYIRLAKKYAPDVSKDPNAHSRMVEINEAKEVLKDPARRNSYHREWLSNNRVSNNSNTSNYTTRNTYTPNPTPPPRPQPPPPPRQQPPPPPKQEYPVPPKVKPQRLLSLFVIAIAVVLFVAININSSPQNYHLDIVITPSGAGSVYPSGDYRDFESGSQVLVSATPVSGYVFDYWSGEVSGTSPTVTITMTSDKSVTAHFKAVQNIAATPALKPSPTPIPTPTLEYYISVNGVRVTLSALSFTGGNVSFNRPPNANGKYASGTSLTMTAQPEPGWKLGSWSGTNNNGSTSLTNTVTLTSDKSVTVSFIKITYSLTVQPPSPLEGGTISPSPGNYNKSDGEVVTLIAAPTSGWQIERWSGTDNDTSTSTTNTVTMNSAKSVRVYFKRIPRTLVIQEPSPSGAGNISPSKGTYTKNDSEVVTIKATPTFGWEVERWNGTNNDTSTSNNNTVTMNSDKVVSVYYKQTVPITVFTYFGAGVTTTAPFQVTSSPWMLRYVADWDGSISIGTPGKSLVNQSVVRGQTYETYIYDTIGSLYFNVGGAPASGKCSISVIEHPSVPTPSPGTLYSFSGTYIMTTSPFQVTSSPWLLRYTADWNGSISIGTPGKSLVNQSVVSGQTYETYIYNTVGSLYFNIGGAPTNGHWTVSVIEHPSVPTPLPGTLYSFSGTYIMTTSPFQVTSSPWILRYTADWNGSISIGTQGKSLVNQSVVSGQTYETYIYDTIGSLYFNVGGAPTNGHWTVSVIKPP